MFQLKEKLLHYSENKELLQMFYNGVENELEILNIHLKSIEADILAGLYIQDDNTVEEELEEHKFESDRSTFDEILPLINGLNINIDKIPSYPYKIYNEDEEYETTEYFYDYQDVLQLFKELDHFTYFVTMIYIAQNMENYEVWSGIAKRVKQVLRQLNIKIPNYGKRVFVAMSFNEELKELRKQLCIVIEANGFKPVIIDSKEHNNQIVPEIFYEIERAEFVIADLTHHKAGVYYEAGYAKGVGKQVIFTCRKDEFEKRHFDVAQTNTIVWESEYELNRKLSSRIEAMYLLEEVR
ncbi:hypothetical protein [Bacillus cereus]|uniref:Uncharacterized protein n=1 Tax=Bacillus cereus TaxID=1396 RepID=A0ABD7DPR6_BACCE|nr:hypothetical protein [Bacillus cereus]MED3581189.1 hypothetical protein [Bacillus thuringiensis]MCU4937394.1 nucleoside 2-deoxyribosyltransferase [Bacillus cereus]MCU5622954.1 nucleoside 2-deoxyribosyltransferase [Bacillus cereus]MCU5678829.1 nucleoside 2-deoxyribosyltransferase [Bacillus cereus]MDA2101489.1 hypothetical protein [Bacillus cereus]